MIRGGASAISAFLSVCLSDQCIISPTPHPTEKKKKTRGHGHPRHRQKTFSLQPVIRLFTALWPCIAHAQACTYRLMYSLTPPPPTPHTHTHTQGLLSECVRAGLLQLSGGLGWGPKRLWNLPEGSSSRSSSSRSGHVSFSLLCHRPQTPSTDSILVNNHLLFLGIALWYTEP